MLLPSSSMPWSIRTKPRSGNCGRWPSKTRAQHRSCSSLTSMTYPDDRQGTPLQTVVTEKKTGEVCPVQTIKRVMTMGLYQFDPVRDPRWTDFLERHPRASVFH